MASLRLDLQDAAQSKKWVDWLKSFGDEMNDLDSLADEKKKEYLSGLIERIDVRYNADERAHELTLTMVKPIVNDGIKYTGKGKAVREYEIVPGSLTTTVVSKKKDGRG